MTGGTDKTTVALLDELATLDPRQRHEVAERLRRVSETAAEYRVGYRASHTPWVLASLIDPP